MFLRNLTCGRCDFFYGVNVANIKKKLAKKIEFKASEKKAILDFIEQSSIRQTSMNWNRPCAGLFKSHTLAPQPVGLSIPLKDYQAFGLAW